MSHLLKTNYDKLLLGFAIALVALSAAWFWQQLGGLRRLRGQTVAADLSGSAYQVANLRAPDTAPAVWPKAAPQSSGRGWLL